MDEEYYGLTRAERLKDNAKLGAMTLPRRKQGCKCEPERCLGNNLYVLNQKYSPTL